MLSGKLGKEATMCGISENEREELQALREMKSGLLEIARNPERPAIRAIAKGRKFFFVKAAVGAGRGLPRGVRPKAACPTNRIESPLFDGSHSTVPGHLTTLNWSDLQRR
jgi:hypothetical protein